MAKGKTTDGALPSRFVAAATIGNALEFYDFITYAFFAIQIGHAFFPRGDAETNLMLSLATFAAGFITRPLGGIVIGALADRVGRKPAMMLSFTLMGASIVFLALIPSYQTIGIAAPILAVAARMVQGFSLGGEVGPTTAYLLEAAPIGGRGLAVAWQGASQNVAAAVAGLVGAGLSLLMPADALDAYGWRIAFLLGAVTLPFGLWMRRGMVETLDLPESEPPGRAAPATAGEAIRTSRRIILLGLVTLSGATIGGYVLNYMTTFAEHTLRLAPGPAFWGSALGNMAGAVSLLLGGWLSDRLGRRPLMIWANLAFMLMVLPLFLWIIRSRDPGVFIIANIILAFFQCLGQSAFYVAIIETLPKAVRGAAFATVYAVAISLFGGTTQLVITWLIKATGDPLSPAWYLLAGAAVSQGAMMLILESAPVRAARAKTAT